MRSISAIVLAAGRSRRMGCQKLLLPFGGRTVIATVVDAVLQGRITRTCVVIGSGARQIRAALAGRRVRFVSNPDPEGDMLSSVRCGLRALPSGSAGVLIALGDQPTITAALIDAMIDTFSRSRGGIIVPVHRGRRGHPLLVAAKYAGEILRRFDGVGLRGLLQAHADEVQELNVASATVLADLDTPEDYRRALARFGMSG